MHLPVAVAIGIVLFLSELVKLPCHRDPHPVGSVLAFVSASHIEASVDESSDLQPPQGRIGRQLDRGVFGKIDCRDAFSYFTTSQAPIPSA